MRILYVNDAWAIWGGLERVLIDKMNFLADYEGYDIFTFTHSQGTHSLPYPLSPKVVHRDLNIQLHHQYRYHGLKRLYYRYKLEHLLVKRLQSGIKEIVPDIIVSPRIELVGYILRANHSIPIVYESHSTCEWMASNNKGLVWLIKQYVFKRQVKKVQMIVALTEGDAAEWRKYNHHVSVIPNIVHLNHSGVYSDCMAKSVIFVGRFSWQKDIGSLIKIWSLVHQSHPDWCLHIYGGYGEEQDAFYAKIKQMDANIQVHESTPHIMEKYRENSIVLLTSVYETFGLVLPEAMSCGLPVVAFDCPYGPADIVTDGVDGFLIRHRSLEDFADKVSLLMDNQELRRKMGTAGIASSRRYEASNVMPLWKELFTHLINR